MEKSKYYILFIIILIISNALLISYVFKTNKFKFNDKKNGPRNYIIEQLHFDEQQIKQYDELINWHRNNISSRDSLIRNIKDELYLNINEDSTKQDSLIKELNKIQLEIEQIHLKHFKDISKICREDQKPYFIELEEDLGKLFSRPKK